MNGAYRCTCRGVGVEGLRSGVPLCSSSPRLRRERRECSWMCHSTLSLPLFHSPPVALPLSLSLLLLFHFTFLLALFSSHPVPSTPNECPRASSSLLWELMPVVVRFRQERESGWERGRERQTLREARHLWVYLYGTEGVSAPRAGPTPILCDTSSYWRVPERDQQPPAAPEDEEGRYRGGNNISSAGQIGKRDKTRTGVSSLRWDAARYFGIDGWPRWRHCALLPPLLEKWEI